MMNGKSLMSGYAVLDGIASFDAYATSNASSIFSVYDQGSFLATSASNANSIAQIAGISSMTLYSLTLDSDVSDGAYITKNPISPKFVSVKNTATIQITTRR